MRSSPYLTTCLLKLNHFLRVEMFESCATGTPCFLRDYGAFLAVSFAVNVSISTWWYALHGHISRFAQTNAEENRSKLPDGIALDEGLGKECENTVKWWGRFVRICSALMAFVIAVALLVLRADTPICFSCVALTTISIPLLVLVSMYYRVRMGRIDRDHKNFLEGVKAVERNVEIRSSSLASRAD